MANGDIEWSMSPEEESWVGSIINVCTYYYHCIRRYSYSHLRITDY